MKGQKGYVLAHKALLHGLSPRHWLETFSGWNRLHRERLMLASMSDEALKDIGLSRADVQREVVRPFWDNAMHK